jgi:hypothetical protein
MYVCIWVMDNNLHKAISNLLFESVLIEYENRSIVTSDPNVSINFSENGRFRNNNIGNLAHFLSCLLLNVQLRKKRKKKNKSNSHGRKFYDSFIFLLKQTSGS